MRTKMWSQKMTAFRPSDLSILQKRDPKRRGRYNPSSYFRMSEGELQQMWWSDAGDAVWEPIAKSARLTLKDIALGKK